MRILVFTSKWIGAKCVEGMLSAFPSDDYFFVTSDPDIDVVEGAILRHGYNAARLLPETLDTLRRFPAGHFDWLLNLWGGYIFKQDLLSKVKRSLNIHPAYLPYGRGRDPVVWAIRYGFPAGLTLHEITTGVDEGPILYREQVPFENPERGGDLYARVVERCWRAFVEQWPSIRTGQMPSESQAPLPGTKTFRRRDLEKDRVIDLDADRPSREAVLKLLAHDFRPGYSARIVLDGRLFDATLDLKPVKSEAK